MTTHRRTTVAPGAPGRGALTVPEPDPRGGSALVATRSLRIDGTDPEPVERLSTTDADIETVVVF